MSFVRRDSVLADFMAGPRAIFSPITIFSTRTHTTRPLIILFGVVVFTAITSAFSLPVTIHLLRTTPEISASKSVAHNFALLQHGVFTPIGTVAFLFMMATAVWILALVTEYELPFAKAANIVFIAGVVSGLKRMFVALVLYVRWWQQPKALGNGITTGFDGFFPSEVMATFPGSVLQEAGLFEVWFCMLLAVGLRYGVDFPGRVSGMIACGVGAILVGSKLFIASILPN